MIPENLFLRRNQRDAKLVGKEDVPIGKKHGIAYFALARGVFVLPDDLPFPHDVHVLRLGFTGVEKIVLGKAAAGEIGGESGFVGWRSGQFKGRRCCFRRES